LGEEKRGYRTRDTRGDRERKRSCLKHGSLNVGKIRDEFVQLGAHNHPKVNGVISVDITLDTRLEEKKKKRRKDGREFRAK